LNKEITERQRLLGVERKKLLAAFDIPDGNGKCVDTHSGGTLIARALEGHAAGGLEGDIALVLERRVVLDGQAVLAEVVLKDVYRFRPAPDERCEIVARPLVDRKFAIVGVKVRVKVGAKADGQRSGAVEGADQCARLASRWKLERYGESAKLFARGGAGRWDGNLVFVEDQRDNVTIDAGELAVTFSLAAISRDKLVRHASHTGRLSRLHSCLAKRQGGEGEAEQLHDEGKWLIEASKVLEMLI